MNKRELDLLERAFSAEIDAAVHGGLGIIQTRSKLAERLFNQGYLRKVSRNLGGRFPTTVEGYALTLAGNAAYCFSDRCAEESE